MSADDWHRVEQVDVPDEGRVRGVVVDGRTVALARCGGRLGALENRRPHQGGPLGEGSIENGWLRCPWHGYELADPQVSGVLRLTVSVPVARDWGEVRRQTQPGQPVRDRPGAGFTKVIQRLAPVSRHGVPGPPGRQ